MMGVNPPPSARHKRFLALAVVKLWRKTCGAASLRSTNHFFLFPLLYISPTGRVPTASNWTVGSFAGFEAGSGGLLPF